MNFLNILSDIEQVDPEVYDRLDSRRQVFKHLGGVGKKLTAAALPLFVGAVFNKAYAQTPAGVAVNDVLNFALKLEYLEMYFYQQRTVLSGISSNNMIALDKIAADEAKHVAFLRSVLGTNAIADPGAAQFDYSGGRGTNNGPFANWRTDAGTYLSLAQAFEDTGVRAYKGAAPLASVMANKTVLTAALNIHSVEARHASHIRAMRRAGPNNNIPSQGTAAAPYGAAPKSWISGVDNGGPVPAYTSPVYGAGNSSGLATGITFPAEDSVSQGGLTLSATTLPNTSGFPASAYSEAFDEGLDVTTVSAIARGFTIATSTLF
ncbi:MAG: ferritin-like domain-containing protein [Hymenobacter sp.]|nr:MAG: ferritin-like domain-containing protein [Hymenobacter sp.]